MESVWRQRWWIEACIEEWIWERVDGVSGRKKKE
jgi:hypothetical protein